MNEKQKQNKALNKPRDPKMERVIGFLILDVLALACFGFGGSNGLNFLRVIGISLALFMIPYFRYHLGNAWGKGTPYIAFASLFLLGFSYYWITYYSSQILYGILFNLITSLGLIAFFTLGSAIHELDDLKKEYIALAILGALSLYVLVTMFYSLYCYGPFYVARFKGLVYYFDGVVFPIAKEGKMLDGFLFREASLSVAKLPSFLLACSGVGLFAMKPSKSSWRFYTLLGFACLGLLDLLLAPYWFGLILLLLVYLVLGIHQILALRCPLERRRKIAKITFLTLSIIVGLGLLILLVDSFLGETNSFLRKIPLLFRDGNPTRPGQLIVKIESAFDAILFSAKGGVRSFNFLTFLFGANAVDSTGTRLNVLNTGFFEFDVLYQNGFLGFAGLLFLIFFGIYNGYRYLAFHEGLKCQKMAFTGVLLGLFIYLSLNNDEVPLFHAYGLDEFFSYHSSLLVPATRSGLLLLGTFLLGFLYCPKDEEKPTDVVCELPQQEGVDEKEEEAIHE